MRTLFTLLFINLLFASACGRAEPHRFTLQARKVERVNGCHVRLEAAPGRGEEPFAALQYACGAAESALNEKAWWGDQPQPFLFTMFVGECLPLGDTFYCAEEIKLGEASFKATYKWSSRHHTFLEKVR
jgi:hypothetical protein